MLNKLFTKKNRHKNANAIMLSYLMQNRDSFTQQELNDLRTIAAECPFEYGKAVYAARTLVMQYDSAGAEYINQCEVDNNNQRLFSEQEQAMDIESDFLLYPNPNNGLMYLQLNKELNEKINFVIYDITGKVVKLIALNANNGVIEIDVTELVGGVYFFKAMNTNNNFAKGKIVIIK